MTIAQALKEKNKMAALIKEIDARLHTYNVYMVSAESPAYSVTEQMEARTVATNRIVALKAAISKANVPIVDLIYQQAELKGYVQTLKRMPTNARRIRIGQTEVEEVYTAAVSVRERDSLVKKMESSIEDIQETLDTFNHSTLIDIAP